MKEDNIIKSKKRVFMLCVFLTIGLIYLLISRIFNVGIPCPIYKLTDFFCPGCGISRMFIYISNGDLYNAFRSNIAVFSTLPLMFYILIKYIYGYINNKNIFTKVDNYIIYLLIIILIIFGILRNIPYFECLQPR